MIKIRSILIAATLSVFITPGAFGLVNDENSLDNSQNMDVFSVLSKKDTTLYQAIFADQKRGAWSRADRNIKQLENRLLMGYVLHQRYLHPTAYVSTYAELVAWLEKYNDAPNAVRIYDLARKKRPRGAASPQAPQKRRWRFEEEEQQNPHLVADYATNANPRRIREIEGRVRYLCSQDKPTQALNFLNNNAQRRHLTRRQYDRIRSWIAESYYYNNNLPKAKLMAATIATQNSKAAPLSLWVSGLIAWREKNFDKSFKYFSKMAQFHYLTDDLRAAAGFWAARSALKTGQAQYITPNLKIAAQTPLTFYGQLAHSQLGTTPQYNWRLSELTRNEWDVLKYQNTRIERAAALAQIAHYTAAHTELRWAHGEIDSSFDKALLSTAFALRLWAAQLDIALFINSNNDDALPDAYTQAGLYPVPDFRPSTGFHIDRAVLFGLIRQESKFKPEATSRSGAIGLMQLMPRTASYIARDSRLQYKSHADRLYDTSYNMQLGQNYVRYLLGHSGIDNNLVEMCLAYNWGPGNLRRWKKKTPITDPLLMVESVPNHEARHFVDVVMTNIWLYRARLDQPAPSRDAMAAYNRAIYRPIDGLP